MGDRYSSTDEIQIGDAPWVIDKFSSIGDCPSISSIAEPYNAPFLCCLDTGHEGQHVAAGLDMVVAVWKADRV